jgi:uncharacterized protein YecT (DUF1311 family)
MVIFAAIPCISTASPVCTGDWKKLNVVELEQCNLELTQQTEGNLRKTYQTKLRQLAKSPHQTGVSNARLTKALVTSQKAWERYRTAQCDFLLEQMGEASLGPSWYQGCMQEYAMDRIKWLNSESSR